MGNTWRRQSIVAHFNRRLTDEDDCCLEPDVPSPRRLDCPRDQRGNWSFSDGFGHKPATTFGTMNADVLERTLPGYRRPNFCDLIAANPLGG